MDPEWTDATVADAIANDDPVPVVAAGKLLGVSRRSVERMANVGELERVGRGQISKRSLIELREARKDPTRRSVVTSQELTELLQELRDLTESLRAERRQLQAGAEERQRLVQAATEERRRHDQEREQLRSELESARLRLGQFATASWRERRTLIRELRNGIGRGGVTP
jgi:vacuolar-type H+-ATPase subunit I/STV1